MAGKECVAIGSDLRFGVQLQVRAAVITIRLAQFGTAGCCCTELQQCTCCWWQASQLAGQHTLQHADSSLLTMHVLPCLALPIACLPQTLATDYKKIYKIHDQLFIGLAGLGTDAETL